MTRRGSQSWPNHAGHAFSRIQKLAIPKKLTASCRGARRQGRIIKARRARQPPLIGINRQKTRPIARSTASLSNVDPKCPHAKASQRHLSSVADANLLRMPAIIVLVVNRPVLEPAAGLWRRWRRRRVATIVVDQRTANDAAEKTGCDATCDNTTVVMVMMLVPRRRWLAVPVAVILRWRPVILLSLGETRRGQGTTRKGSQHQHG